MKEKTFLLEKISWITRSNCVWFFWGPFFPSTSLVGHFSGGGFVFFCRRCAVLCVDLTDWTLPIAVDYLLSTILGFLILLLFFQLFLQCENCSSTLFSQGHILWASQSLFRLFIFNFSVALVPVVDDWQSGFGGQGERQIISWPTSSHRPIETLVGTDRNCHGNLFGPHCLYSVNPPFLTKTFSHS